MAAMEPKMGRLKLIAIISPSGIRVTAWNRHEEAMKAPSPRSPRRPTFGVWSADSPWRLIHGIMKRMENRLRKKTISKTWMPGATLRTMEIISA